MRMPLTKIVQVFSILWLTQIIIKTETLSQMHKQSTLCTDNFQYFFKCQKVLNMTFALYLEWTVVTLSAQDDELCTNMYKISIRHQQCLYWGGGHGLILKKKIYTAMKRKKYNSIFPPLLNIVMFLIKKFLTKQNLPTHPKKKLAKNFQN